MKDVKYTGQTFSVPDGTKRIAANSNGSVWAYEYEPKDVGDRYTNYMNPTGSFREYVGQLPFELPPCKAC